MIYLYSRSGELVDAGKYNFPQMRQRAIKMWRKRYAKKFNECFLQIAPDTVDFLIKKNGENKKWQSEKINPHKRREVV